MMYKRGSLSISTNAIVVLIIAVIMLGLIVGLVTNAFSNVEDRLFEQIAGTENPAPSVSTAEPVTISRPSMRASRGSLQGVKVRVLNTLDSNLQNARPFLDCSQGSENEPIVDHANSQVIPQIIDSGAQDEFVYLFRIKSDAPQGTRLCQMRVQEGEAAQPIRGVQFTIEVS